MNQKRFVLLIVTAACLGAIAAEPIIRTRIDESRGIYIQSGKNRPGGRIEGTCVGPCVNASETAGAGSPNYLPAGDATSEAGPKLGSQAVTVDPMATVRSNPIEEYKGITGGQSAGEAVGSKMPGARLIEPPQLLSMAKAQKFSAAILLPESTYIDWDSDLSELLRLVQERKLVTRYTPSPFPGYPDVSSIRDTIIAFDIAAYGGPGTRTDQDTKWWDEDISADYEKRFIKFSNIILTKQAKISTLIVEKFFADSIEIRYGLEKVCQDAQRLAVSASNLNQRGPFDPLGSANTPPLSNGPFSANTESKRRNDKAAEKVNRSGFPVAANKVFDRTFHQIGDAPALTRQSKIAKAIATLLAIDGNQAWRGGTEFDLKFAEMRRQQALQVAQIAIGLIPFVGQAREAYEAYSGEDILTGDDLSDEERFLRVLSLAAATRQTYATAISSTFEGLNKFSPEASSALASESEHAAELLGSGSAGWRSISEKVSKSEGLISSSTSSDGSPVALGDLSRGEMNQVGKILVGGSPTAVVENGRTTYVSRDGLRKYVAPGRDLSGQMSGNVLYRTEQGGEWLPSGDFKVSSNYPGHDVGPLFEGGHKPRASELRDWALGQGWTPHSDGKGPLHFIDQAGVDRLYLKKGSARTQGSEGPHVAFKSPQGTWIDPWGGPASRKQNSHYDIDWDLPPR